MKLRINRQDERIEARKVTLIIGDTEYRITHDEYKGLVINKTKEDNADVIWSRPSASNEIIIK